ncbi:MAG: hypothetical protein K6F80_05350 [Oscillospiraceae bacterium]|nr:hypothetical protein [Oscillospiraceae bacterium]
MTNKETERLVQMRIQQTIPDKAALWERIESNLPEQPTFPEIQKTPSRFRVAYRVIGAAACFLLIVGAAGIFGALRGTVNKSETAVTMEKTADAPAQEYEDAAPAADNYDEDFADAAPAEEAFPENNEAMNGAMQAAGKQDSSPHYSPNVRQEKTPAYADAGDADTSDILLTGIAYGQEVVFHANASLSEEAERILQEAPDSMMKNPPMTAQAAEKGILLTFTMDGQEISLTAVDGVYQMTADDIAYYAPESFQEIAEAIEENRTPD